MKTLKLIFAIFILSTNFNEGNAQDYIPFYLDNVKWTMERVNPVLGPEDGHSYWEIYTLNDTLINDKVYRKVATRNLCEQWPDSQGNLQFNNSIVTDEFIFGGIREENKKVYFLRFGEAPQWPILQGRIKNFSLEEEHLLYDFDVSPGDTIHFSDLTSSTITNGDTSYFTANFFTIIIDQIAPTQDHKRYEVTNSSSFAFPLETGTLMEGVGSSYGFFGSYDSFLTFLRCFSINEEIMFFDQNCGPCSGYVSTNDVEELRKFKIFPNPTSSNLNVVSTTNFKIKEIEIYNSVGKLLIANKYSSNEIQLDLSGFYSGIFFLYIKFENGDEQIEKVVVK
jgi:Secretion system C-terminal sorting domain